MAEPRKGPPAANRGASSGARTGEARDAHTTPRRSTFAGPRAELSAWMRGAVARRRRQIEALHLDLDGDTTVVAPLGRPSAPGSDEDRSCDRCGHFTAVGDLFYPIVVRATSWLTLCGGLCAGCRDREVSL